MLMKILPRWLEMLFTGNFPKGLGWRWFMSTMAFMSCIRCSQAFRYICFVEFEEFWGGFHSQYHGLFLGFRSILLLIVNLWVIIEET